MTTTSLRLVQRSSAAGDDSGDGPELLRLTRDVEGYFLDYVDLGFPEIRDVTSPGVGRDGEDDDTRFVGARAVIAEMTLLQESPLPALDALQAVMHPRLRTWLYLQQQGWTAERRALVRAASFTAAVQRQPVVVQMSWSAPAGVFEDAVASTVTLSPVGASSGGAAYPVSYPLAFDPGLVPGAAQLQVGGTVPALPVIDIYGPCSNPLVRLVGTGEQVRLLMPVSAGEFVRVDMAARTVLLNGDPNQSRYGRLDFASSSWWALPVGEAVQVVFSPEAPGSGCQAVLTWRRTWI